MTVWTDEKIESLREMWADNTLSLSEMAERLGIATRNSVAGKAHRMGLPLRRQANRLTGQRAASPRPNTRIVMARIRRPKPPRLEATIPVGEPPHLHLTLMQINETTCKFPRGDENFTFCGQSVQTDSPYCTFHSQLCYTPPDRRPSNTYRRAA